MKNSLIIAFLLGFLIFTSGCCALPYILKNNSSLNNLTDSVNNTTNIDNSSVQIETTEINGTITDSNAFVLSGASVSLIGNESNYSAVTDSNGNYEITNVQKGIYTIITTKSGFSDDTYTLFLGAGSHTYNPSLTNLCNDYYLINATSNYIITTGYMGTLEQGSVTFTLPYPDHSYYDISPAVDGTASSTSIQQIGSNRMLTWTLKDNDGNTVPFHIYVTYQGKQTEEVFSNRNMDIKEAGIEQPNYFGSVTEPVSGKVLVQPNDPSIEAVAKEVQAEANSNDTWTIAKALFTWLKNNTVYYVTPGTTNSNRYQTAPQVLSTGRGQCVELSSLYISLLRSVGIPAREVSGYSLEGPSNSYLGHQWVEFYDGQWVPVEVSGSGVSMNYMLTYDFGFQTRNQIGTFVDDGSNNAALYDFVPIYFTFSPDAKIAAPMAYSSLYTNKPSNPRYIKTCMNGTISLVSAKN